MQRKFARNFGHSLAHEESRLAAPFALAPYRDLAIA